MAVTASPSTALDRISYDDLYARWERGNWRATEIDFREDRVQWHERFSALQRDAALWNYALFFHGEDHVADDLSPYIEAAPREEQKYFLATQQVDEARHAIFFSRFMREVAGVDGAGVGDQLGATRPQLTWGFRQIFERLDRMADELRKDRSRAKLAQAVTLYHVVVEASLAQPGQHFIESYLDDRDLLPGFRSGMANVALDEQRHIGFGVKLLADLREEDPDGVPHAVAEILREAIPWTAAVLIPPDWDLRYTECFGFTLEDIGEEGARSLETKLRSAGLAVDTLPGPQIFDTSLTPREQARRGNALVRGGFLGEKLGPPSREPAFAELVFDTLRRSVDHRAAPAYPTILQWDFTDFEPWHLRIDDGATAGVRGRAPAPDLTFRISWEDWVDLAAERLDPRRALVTRRLRPKGDLRLFLRLPKLFGS